jgi:hypothetical protein
MGYDAGRARPSGGIAVVIADEECAPKEWRRMVLSILQRRLRCSLIFGVGRRFNLVAAGDIGRLDGTKNHSGKKVRVAVVHHVCWGGDGMELAGRAAGRASIFFTLSSLSLTSQKEITICIVGIVGQ